MIFIGNEKRRELTRTTSSMGIMICRNEGWYCEDLPEFKENAVRKLRQRHGWELRQKEPEVCKYVMENFPEELI